MKRFILSIVLMAALVAIALPQANTGQLATAIQEGKHAAALEMIRAGADVNEAQPDGTRPIHWAVYRVDYDLMDALIAKKAKVDVTNEFGATPLTEATKQGNPRMVKTLLAAGSGTEGANADGQTALMIAIKNGDLPIFNMLIDAGANVNAVEKVQEQTPLMWAAAANRNAAEMVKVLIAKDANVNARAKFNDWPGQITSEPRAQYHTYGGLTPLLYAARGGCYACVEALVGSGANVNMPNNEGMTPLMIALDNSHNGVAKFLLDKGANPHVWDIYGRTALYVAVDHAPGAAAAGGGAGAGGGGRRGAGGGAGRGGPGGPGAATIPAVPGGGQAAAGRGGAPGGGGRDTGDGGAAAPAVDSGPQVSSIEIINLLLAAGVSPNSELNARRPEAGSGGRFADPLLSSGTTPLLLALVGNKPDVAKVLLDKGANPNIYGMGISPWLYATGITAGVLNTGRGGAQGGGGGATVDIELLDLMLKHGADVNAQVNGADKYSGRVSYAWRDPNFIQSNEGMTALHAAARSQNSTLVKYLLDHGARTDIVDASGRTPLDVLNGVPALPPHVTADAEGLIAREDLAKVAPNAPATRGGAGGARGAAANSAVVLEIRTLLQNAATKPQ
ncbi:MAG TPA: ankyrin repeat domain-containing protein [Terriglobia bacterium]|nr:ankyrin repeat domain-containing protein [Terriglobia bacterium]